jgi:hypothetical protein
MLREVYKNSKKLEEIVENKDDIFMKIANYPALFGTEAFMPYFDIGNRSHITITNIMTDPRYEDYSENLSTLQ